MGGSGPSEEALSKLLAADFDPDAYDKLMSEAFNEDYYQVNLTPASVCSCLACTDHRSTMVHLPTTLVSKCPIVSELLSHVLQDACAVH